MATPPRKPDLSAEQRLALEMLDRSRGGCTRSVWAAHGFTLALLVGLMKPDRTDGDVLVSPALIVSLFLNRAPMHRIMCIMGPHSRIIPMMGMPTAAVKEKKIMASRALFT
jgi:hypothetical protein